MSKFDPAAPLVKALDTKVGALPAGLHPPPVHPVPGRVRGLRLFGLLRSVDKGAERLEGLHDLFPNMGQQVKAVLDRFGHKASVLGRRTPELLADRILEYTATFGFQATTFAEYQHSLRGYRSNFNGEFFEWLVEASPELRGDVLHWAGLETRLLAELARRTRGRSLAELAKLPERIVNARNQPVLLPTGGAFQPSARAEDIWLLAGPRRLKYADALTVSPYRRGSGKPSHVALTTVGQYKFRTAIRKLPGQVEADPVRLVDADLLEFTLNGEPHRFRPDQIVFTSSNGAIDINRYAVTHAASIAHGTPRPVYVSDPEVLLGGATPQLTPFVTRGGAARGVLIELNVDSRLPISFTEIILGRQR